MSLYRETLQTIRGGVQDVKPNANTTAINRWVNRAIRDVCRKHLWSDLRRIGTLAIPSVYTTGSITLAQGSKTVIGSATAWPYNDAVNAQLQDPVQYPGSQYVRIGPYTELQKIVAGNWLLVERENAAVEAVAVVEVDEGGIWTEFAKQHPAGATLVQSSLANRQLQAGFGLLNIKAVIDATTLVLENPWGASTASGQAYQILGAFQIVDPYATMLYSAVDPQQGYALNVSDWDYDKAIASDPQLTSSGDPQFMAVMPPSAGGAAQWLIWPPPTSARMLLTSYQTTWRLLRRDNDRLPPFINPSVIEDIAKSIALGTKVNGVNGRDPYYDMDAARIYLEQASKLLDEAIQDDEARSHHAVQQYGMVTRGSMSAEYWQAHTGWPSDYNR